MESVSEESFYSKCSSDKDLATLTEWSESPPDIIINFVYEIGKKPIVHCYDSSGLKQWLNNPENSLAEWISTSGEELHPMGFGGGPDLNRKYVKLYTGEFVEDNENIDKLRKGLRGAIFTAIPMGIKRIGNIFGTFGVSEHHGQLPGYPTYKLQYISSLPYIHKEEEETETEEPEEISEVDEDIFNEEVQEAYQAVMNEILPLTGHYYRRWIPFPHGYNVNDIFNMSPMALLEYLKDENFGDFAVQDLETGYLYDVSSDQSMEDDPHWHPITEEQYLDYRDNRNRYILALKEPESMSENEERYFKRELPAPYDFLPSDILNPDPDYRDLVISDLLERTQGDFAVIDLETGKLYDIASGESPSNAWEEITPEEYLNFRDNNDKYLSTLDYQD